MSTKPTMIACIETGGTTCYLGLAKMLEDTEQPRFEYVEKIRIKTIDPVGTVENIIEILKRWDFDAIGVASFGPVDVVKSSPTYGCMLKTPKPGWSHASILPAIRAALGDVPMAIESDVYAPAMYHSLMYRKPSVCYITIGTGVGASVYRRGKSCSGDWTKTFTESNLYPHSECGHFMIKPHPADVRDGFNGACVFHGGCVEGMASALSISKRKGIPIEEVKNIPHDDEVWDVVAYYIAGLIYNVTLVYVPDNVVVGGGIMSQEGMLERVRASYSKFMNNYICYDWVYKHDAGDEFDPSKNYIIRSSCKDEAGLLGAAVIGVRALMNTK